MRADSEGAKTAKMNHLSLEERVGVWFVIVVGSVTLIFGSWYIWAQLAGPLSFNYTGPKLILSDERDSAEVAKQKATDTDFDSITDYDELYLYKTSPYLADTDSDGLNDQIEITTGADPLCPEGKTCANTAINNPNTINTNAEASFASDQAAALAGEAAQAEKMLNALRNVSLPEMRALLIESGGDSAQIESKTDAEIQVIYNQLLLDLASQGGVAQIIDQVTSQEGTATPETPPTP